MRARPRPILPGQRFGKLTAIEQVSSGGRRRWRVACDCGSEKAILGASLVGEHTKSCGCLARQTAAATFKRAKTKHGDHGSAEYYVWKTMRQRCQNPKSQDYKDYGGRGITVCERWRNYENFLADMGRRPTPRHSLDRVDNDNGYSPDNCRWATGSEQARNRRPPRKS